ncbi:MAG: glycosyl hydrolase [Gemmatimonadales bacterium]
MQDLRFAVGCTLLSAAMLFGTVSSAPGQVQIPQPVHSVDAKFLGNLSWRNIGPVRGGRSLTVTGSPGRPNEYYFGATGGGLWKTVDGGTTWFPVTDGQVTSSSVGAVAVAETNPDIVYIGMGETELRGSITQGDGVYKSVDGGKTWHHIGLEDTQAIAHIRVHPTDPDIVYVAALGHPYGSNDQRGVFRSRDGGVTWTKVLFVSDSAGAADLVIDRRNPNVIYASIWQVYRKAWKMWGGGQYSGLYKSTDGGDTWINLSKNPGMPDGPLGKIGVTVSPADPNRVWAMVEAHDGGVFRSDDGGATWTMTNNERKLRQRNFYYTHIFADPFDRDIVYGLNTGLYKSTDGGKTFDVRISVPHGDNHDLWIDPNNPLRMANANDGGGNVSINGGKTWTEQDFITTQLYHVMTTDDYPYHVCGAQQDNSTVCVPSDDWNNMQARGPNHGWYYAVGGGESGWISQHPTNRDIFYAGSQGALLTRYDRSNGQSRDIQVYPRFFSGEPASALPERWQWTFPIMFSPLDPNVMFTTSQHLWKTTNDGQSWEKISPDLTLADPATLGPTGGIITMDMNGPEIYATIFALAPSNHDVNTIWAGSDDGLLHITRDGGQNWKNITPPDMPKYARVSIIDESKHAPGTAYVAANRYQVDDRAPYVWRTRDYGETWTKIVDGIKPGHFARAVREDPVRPGLLFLGSEHGVYVSLDAGDNWQPLQLNLPDTPIRDLVVKDYDVVVGSHGRGFWILDDIDPLRQLTADVMNSKVTLFTPHRAVRGVENAVFQYYLARDADSVTVEILDATDRVVRSFTGVKGDSASGSKPGTSAGMHRFAWDLRYRGATVFDGMIIWSARPAIGPKAPIGHYKVRLRASGVTATKEFDVQIDPRLKGVTEADLKEQFELASQIRDRTSAANEAVIKIRDVRTQLNEQLKRTTDRGLKREAERFLVKLAAIEMELYQVKNRSGQDPLNFPIKLNNRLASLRRSVERGDARPTDAAYVVFKELSGELDVQLTKLAAVFEEDLPRLNRRLTQKKLKAISTP